MEPGFYDTEAESFDGEVSRYIEEAPKRCINPLIWWIHHKDDFPRLWRPAIDILSVPAMSDEVEREFSRAKLTIASIQARTEVSTLEEICRLRT